MPRQGPPDERLSDNAKIVFLEMVRNPHQIDVYEIADRTGRKADDVIDAARELKRKDMVVYKEGRQAGFEVRLIDGQAWNKILGALPVVEEVKPRKVRPPKQSKTAAPTGPVTWDSMESQA